jgi:hypothetical protein
MTELETRLQRAFAQEAAPAKDPLFRVQIILRRRRAALRRQLLEACGFLCLGAVLAALLLQALEEATLSTRLGVAGLLALVFGVLFARRYLEVPWSPGPLVSARIRSVIGRYWDQWKVRF